MESDKRGDDRTRSVSRRRTDKPMRFLVDALLPTGDSRRPLGGCRLPVAGYFLSSLLVLGRYGPRLSGDGKVGWVLRVSRGSC